MALLLLHQPLQFTGKHGLSKKERHLLQRLSAAGVDRQTLRDQWNVTLWTLLQGKKSVILKIDAPASLDENAFRGWIAPLLGVSPHDIKLKNKSYKKGCCQDACQGCLAYKGCPDVRKNWIG